MPASASSTRSRDSGCDSAGASASCHGLDARAGAPRPGQCRGRARAAPRPIDQPAPRGGRRERHDAVVQRLVPRDVHARSARPWCTAARPTGDDVAVERRPCRMRSPRTGPNRRPGGHGRPRRASARSDELGRRRAGTAAVRPLKTAAGGSEQPTHHGCAGRRSTGRSRVGVDASVAAAARRSSAAASRREHAVAQDVARRGRRVRGARRDGGRARHRRSLPS